MIVFITLERESVHCLIIPKVFGIFRVFRRNALFRSVNQTELNGQSDR